MTTLTPTSASALARTGVTLAASLGLMALGLFVTALAVVASVVAFETNVFAASEVLIALAAAVPLAAFGIALVHKRLWGRGADFA
jgi:hypothetical protein